MQTQKNNTTSKNVQCYKKAVKYNTNKAKATGSHGGATSRRRRIVCNKVKPRTRKQEIRNNERRPWVGGSMYGRTPSARIYCVRALCPSRCCCGCLLLLLLLLAVMALLLLFTCFEVLCVGWRRRQGCCCRCSYCCGDVVFYGGVVCCSLLMAVAHSFPYFLAWIFIHLPTISDVV